MTAAKWIFIALLALAGTAAIVGMLKQFTNDDRASRRWQRVMILGLAGVFVVTVSSWVYFDIDRPCIIGSCHIE